MNETQIQAIIADYRKAVADLDLNPTGWGEAAEYRNAKDALDKLPRALRDKVIRQMKEKRKEKNVARE